MPTDEVSLRKHFTAVTLYRHSILYTVHNMLGQGIKMKTPVLCQDNKSTISLVTIGGGAWRNKYMKVRQESVRERVTAGDFKVEYVCTGMMLGDILTKPLSGELFRVMRSGLLGV